MPTSDNPPTITIKVKGRSALTVELAATRYGLTPSSVRSAITRLGDTIKPADALDGHKDLYYTADLDKALKNRPGRGANLRGHG